MKKKVIGTILLALILVLVFLIGTQRLATKVSGDQYISLEVDGIQCVVASFDVKPVWEFSTHVKSDLGKMERWQELVMVSQTDALKFFDNQKADGMYGRVNITNELVEKQRSYVIDRFRERSYDLRIAKVYIVLESAEKVAHLLIPLRGPQGEYYTSLEWINGSWYLVPGICETEWAVLNAKKIVQASESRGIKGLPCEKIGPVMRKLSAAYLER